MRGGRRTDLEVQVENCRSLSLTLRYLRTLLEMVPVFFPFPVIG